MRIAVQKVAFFVVFLLPVWSLGSEQAQIVTGTRTGAMSVRLALPEFQFRGGGGPQGAEYTRMFNETLWDDLEFSGVVNLVSRSFYPLGRFGRAIDIDTAAWTTTAVDAQFVTFGNATMEQGNFVVESRLWDLKTRIEDREAILSGRRLRTPAGENAVRLVAHQWADMIIEALGGGIRGISQTKIAFVSDRTGAGCKRNLGHGLRRSQPVPVDDDSRPCPDTQLGARRGADCLHVLGTEQGGCRDHLPN